MNQEINNVINYIQNDLKAQVWKGEQLSDSDSSTGFASAVRALGGNNPLTLRHRTSEGYVKNDIKGGKLSCFNLFCFALVYLFLDFHAPTLRGGA